MDLLSGVEFAVQLAFASVPQITTAELVALQQQGATEVTVLDVRSAREFAVSHIPGARHFDGPASQFQVPKQGTVVLYCSVGYRSSDMAAQLGKLHASAHTGQGHVRFVNLKGSLFRWALENRPLVDSQGHATHKVHGYNATWAKLLPDDRVVLP